MVNLRYRRCNCMNNNQSCYNPNVIETSCENTCPCKKDCDYDDNNCGCGFDEEQDVFPENPMLAQSYVPIQYMEKTFKPCVGLDKGTIFPELVSPYNPGDSMRDIEYIRNTNKIGEGCNADGRR